MADTIYPTSLADATTAVRYVLNESSASFWSDAEIQSYIKLGVLNLTSFGGALEAIASITLATSTMEYAVPTDMKVVAAAVYVAGSGVYKGLVKITPAKIASVRVAAITGPPVYFYHFAGKIGVWPIPTVSENTKTIACYGYKTTDDITLIPDEFQAAAIDFAIAQALWKDKRGGEAAQAWARYVSVLSALRSGVADVKLDGDSWMDRQVASGSVIGGGVRSNG